MKTNKFKINKQKIKKTCILLGVLAVISLYLSLLLNSLIVGQGGTLWIYGFLLRDYFCRCVWFDVLCCI